MSNPHVEPPRRAAAPPAPPAPPPEAAPAPGHSPPRRHEEERSEARLPQFERLAYFHGQLLSAADMRTEQNYFREKLKLHNRCLHGHGVLCGFEIELCHHVDAEDAVGPFVKIRPGIAIDSCGNEIVLRSPVVRSLWALLDEAGRQSLGEGSTVSLWVCFCEQPSCRTRPILSDQCGTPPSPAYSRVRDSLRFEARVEPAEAPAGEPGKDEPCEGCCSGCECAGGCVLLARVRGVSRAKALEPSDIDAGARRMLSRYVPTRVDGISWQHGATYSSDEAAELLGTEKESGGLVVHLTRPVDVATLRAGVLDVWVVDGGRGRNGNVWSLEGEFMDLPEKGFVQAIRYRQVSGETLQQGDRVLVTLRGAFVLDACCRPIAGAHVGGKVPLLAGYERFAKDERTHERCARPPLFPGAWTSGSEFGGTTFESWFFIGTSERESRK